MGDNIKMDLKKWDAGAWIGLVWLRIRTGGGLLGMRWWTFGLQKNAGNLLT